MKSATGQLLAIARPVKWWMLLAALLGVLTIGGGIGLISTSAYLISAAALHPSIAALGVAIVGVRFFGIARGIFRYLERYVTHAVTFRLLERLRVWFYQALEPLAPARFLRFSKNEPGGLTSGAALSHMVADIETLQNFYARVIAPPLVAASVGIAMWLFFGAFAVQLALAWLAFYLLVGVGVPWLTHLLSQQSGRRIVLVRSELNTQLVDGIQGMADLVAFGQEQPRFERIQTLNRTLVRLQLLQAASGALQNALGNALLNLCAWTMLIVAIPMVHDGRLSGVYLALLVLAALSSFEAVLPLASAMQGMGSSVEAAHRLFGIVDEPAEMNNEAMLQDGNGESSSPVPHDYSIVFRDVRFSYVLGEEPALDDISFTLPQGRCVAIVGPSGAGKSSIANLLLRFWNYQEGHITLGGHELRQYALQDLYGMMGVVTQRTHLFNTTIRENLLLAKPGASQEELEEAAKQAQLYDFVQTLPQGYDTLVGELGLCLSGGERQRIAIARALLKNAPILVLDEPTANLDALTEQVVLRALQTLMQGRTTLLITHRLVGLEMADEVLVLRQGKIRECGSHFDLLQLEGLYWKMWQLSQRRDRMQFS